MHIELSGESVKDLFESLSSFQEVFEADTACGVCNSPAIRFLARTVEDFKFYELSCTACTARMSFGQAKKGGGLFPKRRDEDGRPLDNRGWSKFVPKSDGVGNASAPAARPSAPAADIPRDAGVAVFADWDAAEKSKAWGDPWVKVAGTMYKLVDGNYQAPAPAKGATR